MLSVHHPFACHERRGDLPTMHENLQVVYVHPPTASAPLDADTTFHVVKTPLETDAVRLHPHEVLLKNRSLSLDPYHRFGLYDPAVAPSQFPATQPGTILSTYGIAEVVRSQNPAYAPGDIVYAWVRWETFTVVDEANLQYVHTVTPDLDPVYYLGLLGTPGLTGYAGITQVAKPKQGETVVVSATTGAVGMVAAQVAKRLGLTMQSYRNSTWEHLLGKMQEQLGGWLREGSMKFKMHIVEGVEHVPTAFTGIFTGENFGKTVVKVA